MSFGVQALQTSIDWATREKLISSVSKPHQQAPTTSIILPFWVNNHPLVPKANSISIALLCLPFTCLLILIGVGMPSSTISRNSASGTSRCSLGRTQHSFNVGDKVQVVADICRLKEMQEGHGGWNPRMAEVSFKKYGNSH
jgi:hypothetical protein